MATWLTAASIRFLALLASIGVEASLRLLGWDCSGLKTLKEHRTLVSCCIIYKTIKVSFLLNQVMGKRKS